MKGVATYAGSLNLSVEERPARFQSADANDVYMPLPDADHVMKVKSKKPRRKSSKVDGSAIVHTPATRKKIKTNYMWQWWQKRFPPFAWAHHYDFRNYLAGDLTGGITIGLICLAQTLAHAYIATTNDIQGPYTAFMPTLVYALLGTSPHASVSSGAMAAILIADQLRFCPDKDERTQLASLMALVSGCTLLLMGAFNLSFAVRFLSAPTLSGFTSGGAILIMVGQAKNLLGFRAFPHTDGIVATVLEIFRRIKDVDLVAFVFGLAMMVLLDLFNRLKQHCKNKLKTCDARRYHFLKRFSEMKEICVAICGVLFGYLTTVQGPHGDETPMVPTIGYIPAGLPAFRPPWDIPAFAELAADQDRLKGIVTGGVLVALTSFLTTYATAKKMALQHNYRLDASQELFALGAAGAVGSFFGAFTPSGSLSRTGLSAECGVTTQLGGVFAAATMGIGLTCLTPALKYLPKVAIAAIIMKSSYSLLDLDTPMSLAKSWKPKRQGGLKRDLVIWCTAFVCTLALGVVWGIGLAVLFSVGMIVHDATEPQAVILGQVQTLGRKWRDIEAWPNARTYRGILVFEFRGPLFFASAEFFQDQMNRLRLKAEERDDHPISIAVLSLESVHHLDSTALRILEDILSEWRKINVSCIISGARHQVRLLIEEKLVRLRKERGLPSLLDQTAFMITISDAVEQARQRFAAHHGHVRGSMGIAAEAPLWERGGAAEIIQEKVRRSKSFTVGDKGIQRQRS